MHYYKATIQYSGTNYAGLQWQEGLKTIQNDFNVALSKLVEDKITTMSASRTDSGVHAFEQIIKISSRKQIDTSSFLRPLNLALPNQIRCINIQECDGNFKPSVDSLSKEYRYLFTNKKQVSKDESEFIANIANPLDTNTMIKCIQAINGIHNFCNFYSSGSNVKSTVREVALCELTIINPHTLFSETELFQIPKDLSQCYEFRIIANGFLKQMIRHLVSAIWMVGSGKMSFGEFVNLLNGPKENKQRWKVAPPNGLYLYKINYPS
ncbi:MAG: tRNA pseudouridine(38-40) synthase TruA [Bdellovibrionales bacterium]|nr:tRNA pseudouridine(38-40) synthase TruA [Bdellovibrionales bacterium]